MAVLAELFIPGATPLPCRDAVDGNDDGVTDILVSPLNKNKVILLTGQAANHNNGTTILTYVTSDIVSDCLETDIIVYDFNEDGHLDFICGEHGSSNVHIYVGQATAGVSNGTFANQATLTIAGTTVKGLALEI